MSSSKTNPRRQPATRADVDRAWRRGVDDGVNCSTAIFLTVIVDKYGMEDRVADVWRDVLKLSEEVKEKRVSLADLKRVLKEEYGIE